MSLWGPMPHSYKPVATTCIATNTKQHSNCSTPSTPPYSQTLALENQMVGPLSQCLVGGNNRQHLPAAPPAASSVSMTLIPSQASGSASGKRTRKTNFIDPCTIAPLKKRRIQVEMLSPDDRDKVLQKREKNKVAAEKCRVKRRVKVQQTRAEYDEYLEINENLDVEIRRLKEERQMLEDILNGHKCNLKLQVRA